MLRLAHVSAVAEGHRTQADFRNLETTAAQATEFHNCIPCYERHGIQSSPMLMPWYHSGTECRSAIGDKLAQSSEPCQRRNSHPDTACWSRTQSPEASRIRGRPVNYIETELKVVGTRPIRP